MPPQSKTLAQLGHASLLLACLHPFHLLAAAASFRGLGHDARSERLLLKEFSRPAQLGGERPKNFPMARRIRIRIIPKAIVTMSVVDPAGMIHDRIQTNPFDGNRLQNSAVNFAAHLVKPPGSSLILGAGLGN